MLYVADVIVAVGASLIGAMVMVPVRLDVESSEVGPPAKALLLPSLILML